jgi:hypothetical protein
MKELHSVKWANLPHKLELKQVFFMPDGLKLNGLADYILKLKKLFIYKIHYI